MTNHNLTQGQDEKTSKVFGDDPKMSDFIEVLTALRLQGATAVVLDHAGTKISVSFQPVPQKSEQPVVATPRELHSLENELSKSPEEANNQLLQRMKKWRQA